MEQSQEKGMSIEQCVTRAGELIAKNGICLFLLDVAGSRHAGSPQTWQNYRSLTNELNVAFESYMPEHTLRMGPEVTDKGFIRLLGDGALAGISSEVVIVPILEYASTNYPDLPLRYAVAEDGWDREALRLLR